MSDRLDLTALQELQEIMEEDFALLIETFINDARERYADIEKAVGDWQRLRRAAHAFKGSSSNIGARRLAKLCQRLELYCIESQEPHGVAEQVAAIETEMHAVSEALNARYLSSATKT